MAVDLLREGRLPLLLDLDETLLLAYSAHQLETRVAAMRHVLPSCPALRD